MTSSSSTSVRLRFNLPRDLCASATKTAATRSTARIVCRFTAQSRRRLLLCSASSSGMESSTVQGLYPANRCKTLHLVRHAQGFHNVAGEKDFQAYLSYDYLDASLTPLGWKQVDDLRKHVHASGLSKKIELVITSPLTRTMQTAIGVFGGDSYNDGIGATPLMVEDVGNSGRPAVSSLNCPPFLAVELCREHLV